jgi:outer membrane lipopolysaccharide assembly protein LptE/RlpB
MVLFRIFPLFLLLLPAACGYHFPGDGAGPSAQVQTLYVGGIVNRTTEPFIETAVANAIIEAFSRRRGIRPIEDEDRAEALLTGAVTAYSSTPISYDRLDQIVEYRSSMTLEVTLQKQSDGRTLWKGAVSWSEEYLANSDKTLQEDNEAQAIASISDRLAEELHVRVMDNF